MIRYSHSEGGKVVHYKQWPDTIDGQVDDNGTLRAMTPDEVAELTAILDEADRDTDRAAIKDDLELVKQARDKSATTRGEIVDGDDQLPKWSRDITVATTGDTVRLEQRVGHLVKEVAALNGTCRVLSAVLVRMIRAQNLDSQ